MTGDAEMRERIATIEADLRHLSETVDQLNDAVRSLNQLLDQARGARWAILALVAVGGFIGGKLGTLLPMIGK